MYAAKRQAFRTIGPVDLAMLLISRCSINFDFINNFKEAKSIPKEYTLY